MDARATAVGVTDPQLPALGIHTCEAFVKALKGPNDPVLCTSKSPIPSISKIELAALAWRQHRDRSTYASSESASSSTLQIPKLLPLLLQWVMYTLSTAAKGLSREFTTAISSDSPLRQPAYFTLLHELLRDRDTPSDATANLALSLRISPQSVFLIASAVLNFDITSSRLCLPAAFSALQILLVPLLPAYASSPGGRVTLDELIALLCQHALLLTEDDGELACALSSLLQVIERPWANAATDSVQLSLKSYQTFLKRTLHPWANSVQHLDNMTSPEASLSKLSAVLWRYAETVLFGHPVLRAIISPSSSEKASGGEVTLLQQLKSTGLESRLYVMPRLVAACLKGCKRHLFTLNNAFRPSKMASQAEQDAALSSQRDTSTFDAYVAAIYRPSLLLCSANSEGVGLEHHAKAALTRQKLLEIAHQQKLHVANVALTLWSDIVRETIRSVQTELALCVDSQAFSACIASIRTLWELDEKVVRQHLDGLLQAIFRRSDDSICYQQTARSQCMALVEDLLKTSSRMQEIPNMLRVLLHESAVCGHNLMTTTEDDSLFDASAVNEALSSVIRSYLPSTQIVEVVETLVSSFEAIVDTSTENETDHTPSKKRMRGQETAQHASASCSNVLRLAQPVLASLIVPTALAAETRLGFSRILSVLQAAVLRGLKTLEGVKKQKKQKDAALSTTSAPSVHGLRQAASSLWCWYGLAVGHVNSAMSNGLETTDNIPFMALNVVWSELTSTFEQGYRATVATEQLRIEIVRMILFEQERTQTSGIVSKFLNLSSYQQSLWESTVLRLCEPTDATGTRAALWEMISRRWVLVLEQFASAADLGRLARLLVDSLPISTTERTLRAASLLIVGNAEFFELKRWRAAVLVAIEVATSAGDATTFSILVHFPFQYLASSKRDALILRCVDMIATPEEQRTACLAEEIAIRHWLQSVVRKEQSLSDKMAVALLSALNRLPKVAVRSAELLSADTALFKTVLTTLIERRYFHRGEMQRLIASSSVNDAFLVQLAEILAESPSDALRSIDFPRFDLQHVIKADATTGGQPVDHLKRLRLSLTLAQLRGAEEGLLRSAASTCLERFCSSSFAAAVASPFNGKMAAYLSQASLTELTSLFEVCGTILDSSEVAIRLVLTLATLISADSMTCLSRDLEQAIIHFICRLTPQVYETTLRMLLRAFEMTDTRDVASLCSLLLVGGVSLKQGPEGTLVIAQKSFTALLVQLEAALVGRAATASSAFNASFTLECLRTVHQVSSGRAMVFRPADIGIFLSILSHVLAPAGPALTIQRAKADAGLAQAILSTIISVLSDLVRLRKDLLVPIMPQLVMVLSQLPPLFRQPLLQASWTQRQRLSSHLPPWLSFVDDEKESADNVAQQSLLGAAEAREISRLFVTLTAKSASSLHLTSDGRGHAVSSSGVPRGRKNLTVSGKTTAGVDSLARPLSKHAIYIILAYVQSLLNPSGSFVSPSIKRELTPGLVSLCGVVSSDTLERDWVLASGDLLDQGGKTVFKDEIWSKYERTKYRGD